MLESLQPAPGRSVIAKILYTVVVAFPTAEYHQGSQWQTEKQKLKEEIFKTEGFNIKHTRQGTSRWHPYFNAHPILFEVVGSLASLLQSTILMCISTVHTVILFPAKHRAGLGPAT